MSEENEYNKGRESAGGELNPMSEFALNNESGMAGKDNNYEKIPEGVVNNIILGTEGQGEVNLK